jgi:hypothetical protein
MSHIPVDRPAPSDKKINTHNDFELCMFRHQYFRRVKYNPTEEEMRPFMKIVEHFTKNTFFTYLNLFRSVGMYQEDILNIGRVHLVSFLGLYSLEQMNDKRKEWMIKFTINNGKDPQVADFEQKNKANFTMFFKQRMEDLVRICRQKVRNIKGQPSEDFIVFCGSNKPPKNVKELLKDNDQFGYKKIDFSIFKSIRRKADVNSDATIFKFDNIWYVAIALEQKSLDIEDILGSSSNPYENFHNKRPDELLNEKDEKNFKTFFHSRSNYRKRVILQKFIAKNKDLVHYKDEIKTARKLLKNLGGWVR